MLKLVFVAAIAANGVFMATAKSKARCRKDEVWEKCPDSQCNPLTCSEVGFHKNCPSSSSECSCWGDPRCICKDGKVKNHKGKCINPEDCPECGGDPNAVVVPCARLCPDGVPCAAVCVPNTCECRKGYEYDQYKDKCVPIEDCITVCGPNEIYSSCANGGCGKWNCTQIGQPDLCIDPLHCEGGCICKKGYLRARNGTCVAEDQCYYDVCPKNEIYDLCLAPCPRRTCGLDDRAILCIRPLPVGHPDCPPPKCRCQDGFYTNQKGKCVTWDQCPKCSKPNEIYHPCPPKCPPRRCDVDDRVIRCAAPPKLGDPECEPGCICADGFVRNDKGYCVTRDECPQNQCNKPHEEYHKCPSCSPGTCESIGKKYSCAQQDDESLCRGACRCKSGYYWNHNKECITEEQCLKCSGPNEYYSCGGACDNECSNLSTQNQTHCPIINIKCNEKCYCYEGYARDEFGKCIPIDQCPQNQCNKPHEEYHKCPSCSPGTCESIGKEYSCAQQDDESLCRGACRCKSGYYWNHKKECITEEQCLKCSGPNEYYSCGGACDNECANLSTQNQTHCPIINVKCNEKCYCDEGYARDDCGKCIPIEQCPPETTTTTTTTSKPSTDSPPEKCSSDGLELLLNGSIAFTAKFLYEVVKANPKASVITSPASALIPIGQLALYSDGNTYNELIKVLNLRSKDEIRCVIPKWISKLSKQKDVILNLASIIFANDDFPLSDNFLDDIKTVFNAEAENLNFNDNVAAANRINQWVEDQTNKRIQNIANPDMFSPLTRLVLANAIYFLGNWVNQFNPNNTKARDFCRADNSIIQLPTMYQENTLRYADISNLDCTVLELPYKGKFSFLIFLPNKNNGVLDLLQNLLDTSVFYDAYNSMKHETVQVYLPKMNVTLEFDLAEILKKTGINEIFNPNGASLSGILNKDEPLFVSTAIQKAFVLVNEIGTEAAAANVIVVGTTSARDTFVFKADHPFIFYILSGREPIFCGVFS